MYAQYIPGTQRFNANRHILTPRLLLFGGCHLKFPISNRSEPLSGVTRATFLYAVFCEASTLGTGSQVTWEPFTLCCQGQPSDLPFDKG